MDPTDLIYRNHQDGAALGARNTSHPSGYRLRELLPVPDGDDRDDQAALAVLVDALGADALCPVCRGTKRTFFDEQVGDDVPWDAGIHPGVDHPDVSVCWSCRGDGMAALPYRRFRVAVLAPLGESWEVTRAQVLAWCEANAGLMVTDAARLLAARAAVRWLVGTEQPAGARVPEVVAVAPPGPVITRVLCIRPVSDVGTPVVTVVANKDGFDAGEAGTWLTLLDQAGAPVATTMATATGAVEYHLGVRAHQSLRRVPGDTDPVMPTGVPEVPVDGDPDRWESYDVQRAQRW